jgi:hypothetical protein
MSTLFLANFLVRSIFFNFFLGQQKSAISNAAVNSEESSAELARSDTISQSHHDFAAWRIVTKNSVQTQSTSVATYSNVSGLDLLLCLVPIVSNNTA